MKYFYLLTALAIGLTNCSDKTEIEIPATLIQSARILDIGNHFDASDVYIELGLEEHSAPFEIRIFIAPGGSVIDEAAARNLPATSYQSIPTDGSTFASVQLRGDLADTNGSPLALSTEYNFFFLVLQSGQSKLSSVMGKLTMTDAHPLEGEYVGTWDDNFYVNFGISARINDVSTEGQVSGPFFYTNNFRSCCGGRDDGDITLTLEGTTIKAFVYDQDLVNYKGGCPGLYNGSGSLANFVNFEINFTGNDCDGFHTGGRIAMKKTK